MSEFNSDPIVSKEVLKLKELFDIKCVVETGTYLGETTEFFGKNFEKVYGVEISEHFFNLTKNRCQHLNNVEVVKNSSTIFFEEYLNKISEKFNCILFYLDAHWENYWPLKDELRLISKYTKNKSLIIIDDFFVPDRNFQFDEYENNVCNFDYIKNEIELCYDSYSFYYLNSTERNLTIRDGSVGGVGKIYILPDEIIKNKKINLNDLFTTQNGINYSNF